jgi:hypothetical protein
VWYAGEEDDSDSSIGTGNEENEGNEMEIGIILFDSVLKYSIVD